MFWTSQEPSSDVVCILQMKALICKSLMCITRAAIILCITSAAVQELRNVPEAPQLPASYPAMMVLALCPPLFSRVMDPRAMAYASNPHRTAITKDGPALS